MGSRQVVSWRFPKQQQISHSVKSFASSTCGGLIGHDPPVQESRFELCAFLRKRERSEGGKSRYDRQNVIIIRIPL